MRSLTPVYFWYLACNSSCSFLLLIFWNSLMGLCGLDFVLFVHWAYTPFNTDNFLIFFLWFFSPQWFSQYLCSSVPISHYWTLDWPYFVISFSMFFVFVFILFSIRFSQLYLLPLDFFFSYDIFICKHSCSWMSFLIASYFFHHGYKILFYHSYYRFFLKFLSTLHGVSVSSKFLFSIYLLHHVKSFPQTCDGPCLSIHIWGETLNDDFRDKAYWPVTFLIVWVNRDSVVCCSVSVCQYCWISPFSFQRKGPVIFWKENLQLSGSQIGEGSWRTIISK